MNYIPLNVKTEYELLSSLIKIDNLCKFVKSKNINSVSITDTNMFGTMEFINACKKYNLKPIIGVPFSAKDINCILYAKNYNGYVGLLNLVSLRNMDKLSNEDFYRFKDNLICATDKYEQYNNLCSVFDEVYLSYSNKEEKNSALTYTSNIVYSKECKCIAKDDMDYLIYLEMIRDGKTINDRDEYSYSNYIDIDIPEEDMLTTIKFSSLINIELPKFSFDLPKYTSSSREFLRNLCVKGLNKRLSNNISDTYKNRLLMELDVIDSMGYSDYFLIVYDIILYAKKSGIVVGPGRGSACGSLVSYSLGITEVDPIKYGLIFERFLNKDRVSMPDIDTDIEYLRRDEVISYIKNKYGSDKALNIITFGTMMPKQVIRDVSRVLNIDNNKVEEIVKTINKEESFEELKSNTNFINVYKKDSDYAYLIKVCSKLVGLKRHTSIHAAGIVISSETLMNKVPIYVSESDTLIGYTKEYLESLGLLKIDLLALKNLTIIKDTLSKIEKYEGFKLDLNKIPLDDKQTIEEVFSKGNTTCIFQFESDGMKSFLKSLKATSFNDLVSAIALYRPGPKDMINEYISVKNNNKKPSYIVPELESILESTNGIIIYQEQIMDILKVIGSFSYSEADNIRRAMSKKSEELVLKYKSEFIKRAINNGYKESDVLNIFNLIIKFASYGFNKSHSVAYSIVSFQMAYLKVHYSKYFVSTILDMVTSNNEKTKAYMNDGKKFDLKFSKCNINVSSSNYVIKDNYIYMSFGCIKALGKKNEEIILKERSNGLFLDYFDFIKRMYKNGLNTSVIECLIFSSSLDVFGLNKKTMYNNLNIVWEYAKLSISLDIDNIERPELMIYEEYTSSKLSEFDLKYYGFYVGNHPASKYIGDKDVVLKNAYMYFDKIINAVGLVESIREVKTKKKEDMAFLTISDEESGFQVTLFPRVYKEVNDIKKGSIVRIMGRVEKRFSDYQLVASKVDVLNKGN